MVDPTTPASVMFPDLWQSRSTLSLEVAAIAFAAECGSALQRPSRTRLPSGTVHLDVAACRAVRVSSASPSSMHELIQLRHH